MQQKQKKQHTNSILDYLDKTLNKKIIEFLKNYFNSKQIHNDEIDLDNLLQVPEEEIMNSSLSVEYMKEFMLFQQIMTKYVG